MKKLAAMLLALCLLPLCALAEMGEDGDVTVTLPGMEFFFTPIEGGYLLTRESSASVFNRLGLSQREMLPWMEEYDLYAVMYDAELTCEVQIAAYESTETDYDELTEYGEKLLCGDWAGFYAEYGYDVQDASMYYAADGHKFVRTLVSYTYEDGYVEHQLEYVTSQAGYTVQIVLFPYEGAPTEAHTAMAERIADSMWIRPVGQEAELRLDGIRVRLLLPEGVTLLTGRESADAWNGLDEEFVRMRRSEMSLGWIHGLIVAPDCSWEISWCLLQGDGGNLDFLNDENAERFCQDMMASHREDGNNVTAGEVGWLGAHRYVHISYDFVAKAEGPVQAEEYYTRQDGWNVVVLLKGYDGADLTEPSALLEAIVASQRITVDQ